MAGKKAGAQSKDVSERRGNVPRDGLIDLLNEVKTSNLLIQILIPLLGQALELQYLTGRVHKSSFRPDLWPKLDKAAKLARAGLSDIATQDVNAAKKRLKDLDAAVQEVRDFVGNEMILTVRGRKENINKVGAAIGPLASAGFLVPFSDGEYFHLPTVRGAVEVLCEIAQGPYAKAGFIMAAFEVTTATSPVHYPDDLKPVPLKVTRALDDTQDNYEFGADTAGRIAALALCGAGVTQLNENNDAYSGDPGNEMRVVSDKTYFDAVRRGFWAAKSNTDAKPGFIVSKL
jgi:hypothetical protein